MKQSALQNHYGDHHPLSDGDKPFDENEERKQ